ncbi:MFS transporter [Corynebacterium phocae]|uniref:MFS transporter n=1 Tax=Corynebacterium phocae TaxID=161895 RepID=UPI000951D6FD
MFLLSAAAISGLGDGLVPTAFAIQSHRLDDSGRGLTIVLIALWIGRFASSLLVQRLPSPVFPVRWMLWADGIRMLAQLLLLAWAHMSGLGYSIVALAISALFYGIATSFFTPGRFGLISTIFTADERQRVNGALSIIGDIFFVAGPVVGTWLMLWFGFDVVLLLDAATFAVGMVLLSRFYGASASEKEDSSSEASEASGASGASEASEAEDAVTSSREARGDKLPYWVTAGLATWFAVSLTVGYLGSAAPTFIMNRFDESSWGWVAMGMAAGSLIGSSVSMTSWLNQVSWRGKQGLACLMVMGQVLALVLAPHLALVIAIFFLGSALATLAGIAWDILGQAFPNPGAVHSFATRDQLVNTTAIPLGMLLVAFTAGNPMIGVTTVLIALGASVVLCVVPGLWKGIGKSEARERAA